MGIISKVQISPPGTIRVVVGKKYVHVETGSRIIATTSSPSGFEYLDGGKIMPMGSSALKEKSIDPKLYLNSLYWECANE